VPERPVQAGVGLRDVSGRVDGEKTQPLKFDQNGEIFFLAVWIRTDVTCGRELPGDPP
jgi:hypothetical protein